MKVEIYTETTIKGPCSLKMGEYAVLVVYQTQKGPAKKWNVKEEELTTFHRSMLLAILEGLEMLKAGQEIEIYTSDAMLVNMVHQGNVEKWRREEWRRPQDKELKNKELWQQLWEQTQKHTLTFVYTQQNAHSEELQQWIRDYKEKKEADKNKEETADE